MDKRESWTGFITVAISVLALLGGMAIASGILTPASRLDKDEAQLEDHEKRLTRVEQQLDDIDGGIQELLRRTRR